VHSVLASAISSDLSSLLRLCSELIADLLLLDVCFVLGSVGVVLRKSVSLLLQNFYPILFHRHTMKYFRYIRSFHSSVHLVLPQCDPFTFPLRKHAEPIGMWSCGPSLCVMR
jgi:hypothetical protein